MVKKEVKGKYVIVGNSIGSLVTLTAAKEEMRGLVGVYLVNCAGGMNGLHITKSKPGSLKGLSIDLITNLLRLNFVSNFLFDRT